MSVATPILVSGVDVTIHGDSTGFQDTALSGNGSCHFPDSYGNQTIGDGGDVVRRAAGASFQSCSDSLHSMPKLVCCVVLAPLSLRGPPSSTHLLPLTSLQFYKYTAPADGIVIPWACSDVFNATLSVDDATGDLNCIGPFNGCDDPQISNPDSQST